MSVEQNEPSGQTNKLSFEFISWFLLPFLVCSILCIFKGVPYEKLEKVVSVLLTSSILHLFLKKKEILIALSLASSLILFVIGYNYSPVSGGIEPPVVTENITLDLSKSINSCIEANSAQCRKELYERFKIDPEAEVLLSDKGNTPMKISGGLDAFLASTIHLMEIKHIEVVAFKRNSSITQLTISIL